MKRTTRTKIKQKNNRSYHDPLDSITVVLVFFCVPLYVLMFLTYLL